MSLILKALSKEASLTWKYFYHLSDFYTSIAGFLFLQSVAWYLARMAADHGLLGDIITRVAFFVINCLLVLIFENKIHFFQYRLVWMVMINGCLVLLSTQMNPIFTFIGL
jgi:hypothetical protein